MSQFSGLRFWFRSASRTENEILVLFLFLTKFRLYNHTLLVTRQYNAAQNNRCSVHCFANLCIFFDNAWEKQRRVRTGVYTESAKPTNWKRSPSSDLGVSMIWSVFRLQCHYNLYKRSFCIAIFVWWCILDFACRSVVALPYFIFFSFLFFFFFLIDIVTIMLCYVLFLQWRLTVV